MRSILLGAAALMAVASAAKADPSLSESVSGNLFTLGQTGHITANWSGFAGGETLDSATYTFALVPLKPIYTPQEVQTGSTPVYGYFYPPAGTVEPNGQIANGSDFPQQHVVGSTPIFTLENVLTGYSYAPNAITQTPIYTLENVQTGSTPIFGYVYPPAGTVEPDGQIANGSDFPQQQVVGSTPIFTLENVLTGYSYSYGPATSTVTVGPLTPSQVFTEEEVQTGSTPIFGYVYPPAGTVEPDGQIANGSDFPQQQIIGSTPIFTLENVFTGYQPVSADFTFNTPGYYLASVTSTVTVGDPYSVTSMILSLDQSDEIIHVAGVPEPAAWALMLAGFGFAGTVLRRSRAVTTTA